MTTLAPASTRQSLGQAQLLAQADTTAQTAVGNSNIGVVNLVPGQSGTIKIQAGQHLSVRRPVKCGTDVRSEVPDNLIAIRRGDAAVQELKVWRDATGDGVSQANELLSLANLGIASFNLSATECNAV